MHSSGIRKKMPLVIAASAILLASIVTACCLFSFSDDSSAETSGSCGANLDWSIEPSTGHLTITGTGDMDNYGDSDTRWGGNTVRSVDFPDGLTSIGNNAFSGCEMTSVTIPDNVTSIGQFAFDNCRNLTALSIGSGVTSINGSAFFNCDSLTSVTIPDNVTYIGANAFAYNGSLVSINIGKGVSSIGDYPFVHCDSLVSFTVSEMNEAYRSIDGVLFNKSGSVLIVYPQSKVCEEYTVPDTVTTISDYAFENCPFLGLVILPDSTTYIGYCSFQKSSITSVTMGPDVSFIGAYAFYRCSNLTSAVIPDNVTSILALTYYGCTGLTSAVIPDSITSIENSAFEKCSNLTTVSIGSGVTDIETAAFRETGITTVNIPNSVTNIGARAFYRCPELVSVTIGSGVTTLGENVFAECGKLESITVSGDNTAFSSLDGVLFDKGKTTLLQYPVCKGGQSYTVPSTVSSIADAAFAFNNRLTSVTMPDSVTTLGTKAFRDCPNLTSLTLGSGLANIGNEAFRDCCALTSITMPDSVTSVGSNAFTGCSRLSTVTIGSGTTAIADNAFTDCPVISSFTVSGDNTAYSSVDGVLYSKNVTRLLKYPSTKESAAYSIPDTVTTIDENAFYRCYGLRSLTVPDGVLNLPGNMVYHCPDLVSVTIGSGVSTINMNAFRDCERLESFTVSADNTTFSSQDGVLFNKGKTALLLYPMAKKDSSYSIPATVTEIGNSSFRSCSELRTVTIPDSVTSVGDYAFSDCSRITSVTIGSGVTAIGANTFSGCPKLASITVAELNAQYSSLDGVLFNKEKTTLLLYPMAKDGKSYAIPDTVVLISNNAFCRIPALVTLTIPASLDNIGENTFMDLTKLESVTVSELNTRCCSVDGVLFNKDKTGLILYPSARSGASYAIPDGVVLVSEIAFQNCANLQTLTVPDSVETINTTFDGCNKLKTINIGSGVNAVAAGAFRSCYGLESIVVSGDNTTFSSLDGILFDKEKKILIAYPAGKAGTSYTIPNSITAIGRYAFNGALNIESLSVPAETVQIDMTALCDMPNLKSISVANGNGTYTSKNGVLCSKETGTVIWCPAKWTGILELNGDENNAGLLENLTACEGITGFQVKNPSHYSVRDGILYYKAYLFAYPSKNSASTLNIPKDAQSLATATIFYKAENLTGVTVAEGSTYYTANDGTLFDEYVKKLMFCPSGKESFVIPSTVTNVYVSAFSGNSLKKVTFKSGMTATVGKGAFMDCTSLLEIVIEEGADVTFDVNSIIFDDNETHTIYVVAPDGYRIDTTGYRSNLNLLYGEPPGPIPPEPPTPPEPTGGGGNNNTAVFIAIGVVAAVAAVGAAVFMIRRR